MTKFQGWARSNYDPITGVDGIDEMWHPEIQEECQVMLAEYRESERQRKQAEQARVKEVVASVEDLEEQMKGKIVFFVRFKGSLPATKKLTKAEADLLRGTGASVTESVARKCGADKPLFGKFEAYEKLERQRAEWKEQLKQYGVPFFGEGMTVIDIRLIPEVESLCDEIDRKLPILTEEMLAAYPEAIKPEAVDIGPLHNPRDYKSAEELRRSFYCQRKWMPAFDVPDILKEVDMARWEAEKRRSAELWAEVRQNGMVLLRKQMAEMTARLVESVSPDAEGGKKRFYATSITNLTDFFETFERRDLAGDRDLAAEVQKLKDLVSGKDIEKFKTDEGLRKQVATAGAEIAGRLDAMLVSASARSIRLRD